MNNPLVGRVRFRITPHRQVTYRMFVTYRRRNHPQVGVRSNGDVGPRRDYGPPPLAFAHRRTRWR